MNNNDFWLLTEEKTRSDATLLYEPRRRVRFGHWFFGPGNRDIFG